MKRKLELYNIIAIVLASLTFFIVSCSQRTFAAVPDSHSCPEPGHGPCYLCDK